MNEEQKESNEIEINESESNEKTRSPIDPRKGQAFQDASEWEREIKEARIRAVEIKKQKEEIEKEARRNAEEDKKQKKENE